MSSIADAFVLNLLMQGSCFKSYISFNENWSKSLDPDVGLNSRGGTKNIKNHQPVLDYEGII